MTDENTTEVPEEIVDNDPLFRTPFVPNPLFSYGRIDTSAGEGGESLHKLNPGLFGVADGVMATGAASGTVESTSEDIVLQPTSGEGSVTAGAAALSGTVDTQAGSSPLDVRTDIVEEAPAEGEAEVDGEAEGEAEVEGYAALSVEDLRAELKLRDLPTSGSKPKLIAALEADDAAKA